jgi:hypothetical protein
MFQENKLLNVNYLKRNWMSLSSNLPFSYGKRYFFLMILLLKSTNFCYFSLLFCMTLFSLVKIFVNVK